MTDDEAGKRRILDEIRRAAEANGGVPLGIARFGQETGIKESDWRGKIWPRWADAISEAGFEPNQLQTAYADEHLIEKFIELTRALGHVPVATEVRIKARNNDAFPSHNTFGRFGSRRQLALRVLEHCKARAGYDDVAALLELSLVVQPMEAPDALSSNDPASGPREGYVYLALLEFGRERRYKIGKAVLVERRKDQIAIQLPEELKLIHTIKTDDAYGIEQYWPKRFSAKNTKGEWFILSRGDVEAFRRRKFM